MISEFCTTRYPSLTLINGGYAIAFLASSGSSDLGSPWSFEGASIVLFLHSRLTLTFDFELGRMRTLKICLPVQSRSGLRIVGGGMVISSSAS